MIYFIRFAGRDTAGEYTTLEDAIAAVDGRISGFVDRTDFLIMIEEDDDLIGAVAFDTKANEWRELSFDRFMQAA